MRRFLSFFADYGFYIMLIGFFTAIVSLVIFMRYSNVPGLTRSTALTCFFIGIIIYVTGRISVLLERRLKKRIPPDLEPQ